MAVDENDRQEYERGREVTENDNFIDRFVKDQHSYLLGSESEHAAYTKGRNGEQFDGDKNDE